MVPQKDGKPRIWPSFCLTFKPYTKPLRELTYKQIEWRWDQPQERAFKQLQEAITSTPVLRYYNVAEEVTIQCDVSQTGLGLALMLGGQPVAYASQPLTGTETRYVQIEKELSFVSACNKFEVFIYTGTVCMWSRIISHWRVSCRNHSTMPQSDSNK